MDEHCSACKERLDELEKALQKERAERLALEERLERLERILGGTKGRSGSPGAELSLTRLSLARTYSEESSPQRAASPLSGSTEALDSGYQFSYDRFDGQSKSSSTRSGEEDVEAIAERNIPTPVGFITEGHDARLETEDASSESLLESRSEAKTVLSAQPNVVCRLSSEYFACGMENGRVIVWDFSDGSEITRFTPSKRAVLRLASVGVSHSLVVIDRARQLSIWKRRRLGPGTSFVYECVKRWQVKKVMQHLLGAPSAPLFVTSNVSRTVQVWSSEADGCVKKFVRAKGDITCLTLEQARRPAYLGVGTSVGLVYLIPMGPSDSVLELRRARRGIVVGIAVYAVERLDDPPETPSHLTWRVLCVTAEGEVEVWNPLRQSLLCSTSLFSKCLSVCPTSSPTLLSVVCRNTSAMFLRRVKVRHDKLDSGDESKSVKGERRETGTSIDKGDMFVDLPPSTRRCAVSAGKSDLLPLFAVSSAGLIYMKQSPPSSSLPPARLLRLAPPLPSTRSSESLDKMRLSTRRKTYLGVGGRRLARQPPGMIIDTSGRSGQGVKTTRPGERRRRFTVFESTRPGVGFRYGQEPYTSLVSPLDMSSTSTQAVSQGEE